MSTEPSIRPLSVILTSCGYSAPEIATRTANRGQPVGVQAIRDAMYGRGKRNRKTIGRICAAIGVDVSSVLECQPEDKDDARRTTVGGA